MSEPHVQKSIPVLLYLQVCKVIRQDDKNVVYRIIISRHAQGSIPPVLVCVKYRLKCNNASVNKPCYCAGLVLFLLHGYLYRYQL